MLLRYAVTHLALSMFSNIGTVSSMDTGCKPLSIAPLNISQVLVKTNFVFVFGYLFTKLNVDQCIIKEYFE